MIYLRLFWEFLKTGLFSIGGGMATIPFLQRMSQTTGWFTTEDLANMIAVSESTPGPIGVNMATYVGFKTCGVPGGIIATIGLILPSIVTILIIAGILEKFRHNRYVEHGFYGLRPASVGLIAAALLSVLLMTFFGVSNVDELLHLGSLTDFNIGYVILAAVLIFLTRFFKPTKKLHPLVFIAASAVVGIILKF